MEKEQQEEGTALSGTNSLFWPVEMSTGEGIGSRSSMDCRGETFFLSTTPWKGVGAMWGSGSSP